jgi:predicted RNase H-like nuclease (RuvC/YqgF family)
MAKLRKVTAIIAVVLGSLTMTGAALAEDRQPQRSPGDHQAFCERLEQTAQALRAKIGEIQAVQERIRAKIASGELTRQQEARAKHALRKLEALQEELQQKLERVLEIYGEKCQR